MSDRRKIKKEALRMLKSGELQNCLDYLLDKLENQSIEFQDLIHVKARFEDLRQQNVSEKLKPDTFIVKRNQINHALVEIVMALDQTPASPKQNMEQIKKEAKRLLKTQGIEESLEYLSTEFEDFSTIENTIVLLYARWNSLRNDKAKGVITKESYRDRKKNIKKGLLRMIDFIDKAEIDEKEQEKRPLKSQKKEKTSTLENRQHLHLLRSILSLQIVIIMGIVYIIIHLPN